MPTITIFEPSQRYIFLPIFVTDKDGAIHNFRALLDTGAPSTEISDEALQYIGLLEKTKQDVQIKPGFQTQKYGKTVLPKIEICSHAIEDLQVYVSHFDKSCGIKALIGLDFFRQFRATVDYKLGQIITEPLLS